MKLFFSICGVFSFWAGAALANLNPLPDASSLPPCDKDFMENNLRHDERTLAINSFETLSGVVNHVTAYDPAIPGYCSYINYPIAEPISGAEYSILTARPESEGTISAHSKSLCPNDYDVGKVYAGYCGTGGAFRGSAYFYSTHLALTSTDTVNAGPVCLEANGRYYDVHQVQSSGTGTAGIAGLSLVHSAPESRGLQVVLGYLGQGSAGATFGMSSFAFTNSSDSAPYCYPGQSHDSNNDYGMFYNSTYSSSNPPSFAPKPGGPVMLGSSSNSPMGLLTGMSYTWYSNTPSPGYTVSRYPVYRRFVPNHASTVASWSSSAAPPYSVTITAPANNSTINGFSGSMIQYVVSWAIKDWGKPVATLDGAPVSLGSKAIVFLTPGWHVLVLQHPTNTSIRHTIRFYHS